MSDGQKSINETKQNKPPPPSDGNAKKEKDLKNDFEFRLNFPINSRPHSKAHPTAPKRILLLLYLFILPFTSTDGPSTTVVSALFVVSIKVTYKLLSQGLQDTSIKD